MIHCSHIPRLLKEKEGFDYVAFQYNNKGIDILSKNPFIDEHIVFNPNEYPVCNFPASFLTKRNGYLVETGKFDKFIDLQDSIEYGYIAMEDMNEYYMSSKFRREKYGKQNYYDQTTEFAGYPQHKGMVGEIFFTDEEEKLVKNIYEERYKGKFVAIFNLSGSSKQKLFLNAEEIAKEFLSRHPDAVILTMGDEDCKAHLEFQGERIINRCGTFGEKLRYPFRQSMLMSKYASVVVGCESGLMVASTLFGTPTIQLMTAASIKNHGGDFPNDLSIQSPAKCSPCHKGPYEFIGCDMFKHLGVKYPICVKFKPESILNRLEEAYDSFRARKRAEANPVSAVS